MVEHKLCYVRGNLAYFTSVEVSKAWGDDWNDAPYEHNAGEPYDEFVSAKVFFEASELWTPDEFFRGGNSPWSVQDINKGLFPWLQTSRYVEGGEIVRFYAGILLENFVWSIEDNGGTIYLPRLISWERFKL